MVEIGKVVRSSVAVALALLLVVASGVTAGWANNFSGANGATGCAPVNMADNGTHAFYYSSVTSSMVSATNWNRINNLNPTDVNTSVATTITSTTDVVVYDSNYTTYCGFSWHGSGGSMIGLVTCVSLNSASECEKHEMRYDTSWTTGRSQAYLRALACHESGHTLGLEHRANSTSSDVGCMPSPLPTITQYTDHDVAHLNAAY